ncbi:hypothetical protein KBZ10_09880 [Streptomyces sp. F63]|uniref:hypothetical protein n=1 Tax=Streptomyces sp. F63 TaxID=2824887 RepID=UPI001B39C49F|nr:hypothetical protein [Streptomyces sp. F63]MBQ0984818.1 hypothetical protein [Streptomyces sp. F63]
MRRGKRVRVVAVAAGGLLAGGVLAGCGPENGTAGGDASPGAARTEEDGDRKGGGAGNGEAGAAGSTIAAAYRKTAEAGTADVTLITEVETGEEEAVLRGSGVIDLKRGTSDMVLKAPGARIEQRTVDGIVYQKRPAGQREQLPEGKTWMSYDLRKLGTQAGTGAQIADPAATLAYAKGITEKDVERIGEESLDGVPTTHYEVAVDVRSLVRNNELMGEALRETVGDTLPLHIWLDDEGRLRQQKMELDVAPSGAGEGRSARPDEVTVATTLKLGDFGTDVDVEPPPAADTVDMTGKAARQRDGKADRGAARTAG